MKFIREIIGEKRQTYPSVNGTPTPVIGQFDAQSPSVPADFAEADMSNRDEKSVEAVKPQYDAKTQLSLDEGGKADLGVSEEVADFFAESEEKTRFEVTTCSKDDFDYYAIGSTPLSAALSQSTAPETTDDVAPDAQISTDEASVSATDGQDPAESDTSRQTASDAEEVSAQTVKKSGFGATIAKLQAESEQGSEDQAVADDPEPSAPAQPEISAFEPTPARPAEPVFKAEPAAAPDTDLPQRVEVPQPAVGRGSSRHGRVKTRLLGFNAAMESEADPMADNDKARVAPYTSFPVGWLIVIEGAGRGSAFTLFHGVSTIGRGEDQTVRLDFGDNSISRESHASIAYDDQQQGFFIGHGGKANIVRRNNRPVLSTEELAAGDTITIGETTLRFVPFCCPEFSWENETATGRAYANQG